MSDENALLSAIAAHPDDDTVRLAYADWLDEHGQPIRAEFIRVQIDIAQKERLPRAELNRHVALFERNQELIDNHCGELLGPLAALPGECVQFRRGFVSLVDVRVGEFVEYAAALPTLRPLPAVRVSQVAARFAAFVRCSELSVVTELSAFGIPATEYPTAPGDAEVRAAVERLTRLAVLDLESCGLGDRVFDLLGSPSVPALRDLDLSGNDLTDGAVGRLLDSGLTRQITRLVFGGNDITDIGAMALAQRWPTGADDKLEVLNLRFTNIGSLGQAALLNRFGGRVDLF